MEPIMVLVAIDAASPAIVLLLLTAVLAVAAMIVAKEYKDRRRDERYELQGAAGLELIKQAVLRDEMAAPAPTDVQHQGNSQ